MYRHALHFAVILVTAFAAASQMNAQSASCTSLTSFKNPGVAIQSAEAIAAGPAKIELQGMPPLPANWKFPAHCLVRGSIHSRTGGDDQHYEVRFELRLPRPWNGKFLFQGGGGLDGVVQPAVGLVNFGALPALSRGYAVVSTDSGHQGATNLAFGHEQQARLDFAYAAIGDVTRVAKAILTAYYGKAEDHSYFVGCSNGGREAMIAAQRYPLEFDGAIAGDPGFDLAHAVIGEAWDTENFASIAPRGEGGQPILSEAFSPPDLDLVRGAVLNKCDALDGIKDGEINNVEACKFDPETLVCRPGQSSQCLRRDQVDVLKRVFQGARDSAGHQLYAGWPYDAGISDIGWRVWKLGTSTTPMPNAVNVILGGAALKEYFVHPYLPDLDLAHINFDKITAEVDETHAINDPISTDLGTFAHRGGRLIIFQGLSDPVFSANDIIDYYRRFSEADGGIKHAASVARLFLIPGMAHCQGGPATDQFDPLDSLEKWVEKGDAPESITASGHTFPGRTRPLCPYPRYASYKGSGDPEKAESFVCK
jgi:Tannase and feruloyl esterase